MSVVREGCAHIAGAATLVRCLHALRRAVAIAACALLVLGFGMAGGVLADDANAVLDRARALEADGLSLLQGQHDFESSLMSPDSDRLTVFLTMPHGARVILNDATLYIDDKRVLQHVFSVGELQALRDRASKILFATRIAPGQHTIRLDLRAMQGNVVPMKTHAFVKGRGAKYIEIQIAGYDYRQPFAIDW